MSNTTIKPMKNEGDDTLDSNMIMKVDYQGEKFMISYNDVQRSLSFENFILNVGMKFQQIVKLLKKNENDITLVLSFVDFEGDHITLESHEDVVLAFRLAEQLPLRVFINVEIAEDDIEMVNHADAIVSEKTIDFVEEKQLEQLSSNSDFQVIKVGKDHVGIVVDESHNQGNVEEIFIEKNIEFATEKVKQVEGQKLQSTFASSEVDKERKKAKKVAKKEEKIPKKEEAKNSKKEVKKRAVKNADSSSSLSSSSSSSDDSYSLTSDDHLNGKKDKRIQRAGKNYEKIKNGQRSTNLYSICIEKLHNLNQISITEEQLKFFNDNFAKLPAKRLCHVKKINTENVDAIHKDEIADNGPGYNVVKDVYDQMVQMAKDESSVDVVDMLTFRKLLRSLKIWPKRFVRLGLINSEMPYAQVFIERDERKKVRKYAKMENALYICKEQMFTLNGITLSIDQLRIFNAIAKLPPARLKNVAQLTETELSSFASTSIESLHVLQDVQSCMMKSAYVDNQDVMSLEVLKYLCYALKVSLLRFIDHKNCNNDIVSIDHAKAFKQKRKVQKEKDTTAFQQEDTMKKKDDPYENCMQHLEKLNGIIVSREQLQLFVQVLEIPIKFMKNVRFVNMNKLCDSFQSKGKGGRVYDLAFDKLSLHFTEKTRMDRKAFKVLLRALNIGPQFFMKRGIIVNRPLERRFQAEVVQKKVEKIVSTFATSLINVVSDFLHEFDSEVDTNCDESEAPLLDNAQQEGKKKGKTGKKENDAIALCISKSFFVNHLQLTRQQLEYFVDYFQLQEEDILNVEKIQNTSGQNILFQNLYDAMYTGLNNRHVQMNIKDLATLCTSLCIDPQKFVRVGKVQQFHKEKENKKTI